MHVPRLFVRATRLGVAASLAVMSLVGAASSVSAQGSRTLVIGVDHVDAANQDPAHGRLFEYTDFFSRSVTVHTGDVINFRTAPGAFHIVGLAKSEAAARAAYPVVVLDGDDPNAPNGAPKIAFGPSNYPIVNGNTSGDLSGVDFSRPNGPPDCGRPDLGEPDCTFSGGTDIEVAGPNLNFGPTGPVPADWRVKIAAQPGTYQFLCFIHPGMRGTLNVVGGSRPASTQAQIDHKAHGQFISDRAQALAAEQQANVVRWTGGAPGSRTYLFSVGVAAAHNHVAIDEMLPNPATVPGGPPRLTKGDQVRFNWVDPHNVHTVLFPPSAEISPFGFDCNGGFTEPTGPPCLETGEFAPEVIGDPGNASSGTQLANPSTVVDSGVLVGTGYNLNPSVQTWSVGTGSGTAGGAYQFHCTVHDFMVGSFTVSGG
jgi:plastocyanin